jgi:hypothetical protein
MKLKIITIVYNGMPFLPMQLNCFNQLSLDWEWLVVEGPAANVNCTSWCKPQPPGHSNDGTHEFLMSLTNHPRVFYSWRLMWDGGKVEMCNRALATITEPCVLLQIDADELWSAEQIEKIFRLISSPGQIDAANFYCRYFLGPNIVTVGDNCYGNNPGEWARAWRLYPGMKFVRHEPPVLNRPPYMVQSRVGTKIMDLVFDHWAYYFEKQVAYKESFYGYKNAVAQWKRLQVHPGPWPVKLKTFLPWVDDRAQADLLHKPTHKPTHCPGDGQP